MPTLTDTERQMLRFESQWFQYAGTKEQLVRERFGLTMTAYTQRLNRLIDTEAALAHDPLTVRRLRRIREAGQVSRSARRLGFVV